MTGNTMKICNQLKDFRAMLDNSGCQYALALDGDEVKVTVSALHGHLVGGIDGTSAEFTFSVHGHLVYISLWGPCGAGLAS